MGDTNHLFEDIVERLPVLIWVTDPQGNVVYANSHNLKYMGFASLAEMTSQWMSRLHPEDYPSVKEAWTHSLATGEPFSCEYRVRRFDDQYRTFLSQAASRLDAQGNIERWMGSSTEIHDQKLAAEALRRNEKLATAGRLAASVAHEINNPLESVTNLLYLLANNASLDRSAREYVNTAQQELARVGEITTQMLRFHRQSTGPVPSRIADMLDSILSLYRQRLLAAEIQLTRDYTFTEPLTCLAGDLRQAFANLIGNAIDATPRNGRLWVRLRHSRDWKTRRKLGIRVTIADTGRGIETINLAQIFEAFSDQSSTLLLALDVVLTLLLLCEVLPYCLSSGGSSRFAFFACLF